MKIRKLHLKNIGVFDDEEIEFKECPTKDKAEIHILTGENGSGKTTILMALASCFKENQEILFSKRIRDKQQTSFLEIIYFDKERIQFFVLQTHEQEQFNLPKDDKLRAKYISFSSKQREPNEDVENYIQASSIGDSKSQINTTTHLDNFRFAVFAYSGYRKIKDEPIEIGKEVDENPLFQSLDFVKEENPKFTVNQWLGQNLLNSSLAQTKKKNDEAEHFNKKVQTLENVINDIIQEETKGNEIRFEMQSATKLVLIKNEQELDFDVLPDGLKSLISWIGDLLMRLDSLKWKDDTPIFEREIILFLDEIEVHLHPAWQRKVLPIVQKLFKNAQIFVSTHSPFVVNSVDDAWVYKLKVDENGKAKVENVERSEDGKSYSYVLEETFDIKEEFGIEAEKELDEFYQLRNSILSNGSSEKDIKKITKMAKDIAKQSEELNTIIQIELRQINRKKGLNLKI